MHTSEVCAELMQTLILLAGVSPLPRAFPNAKPGEPKPPSPHLHKHQTPQCFHHFTRMPPFTHPTMRFTRSCSAPSAVVSPPSTGFQPAWLGLSRPDVSLTALKKAGGAGDSGLGVGRGRGGSAPAYRRSCCARAGGRLCRRGRGSHRGPEVGGAPQKPRRPSVVAIAPHPGFRERSGWPGETSTH